MKKNTELYVFELTLLFFIVLFYLNPSYKITLLIVFVLVALLWLKLKNLLMSLVLTFFITKVLSVGKTIPFVLHTLKDYPYLRFKYPLGLTYTAVISYADVVFAVFFLLFLLFLIRKTKSRISITKYDLFFILLIVWPLISDLFVSEKFVISLFILKKSLEYLVIYWYVRFYVEDRFSFFRLYLFLTAALVIFQAILSLNQFIVSAPLGKSLEASLGIETFGEVVDELAFSFRPLGTFGHANMLALFVATFIPLFFAMYLYLKQRIFLFSFLCGIVVLLLTLSRSAWLGVCIAMMSLLYYAEYVKKYNVIKIITKRNLIILGCIIIPFFIYSLPRLSKSLYAFQDSGGMTLRLKQAEETIELIKRHPLFGVGDGLSITRAIENNKTGVFSRFPSPIHNYYLLMLIENGIFGLLLFIIFFILIVFKLLQAKSLLGYAIIASLIVIFIIGLFQPFFNLEIFVIVTAINFDIPLRFQIRRV